MPNHCLNRLHIRPARANAGAQDLARFRDQVRTNDQPLSFQTLIPPPDNATVAWAVQHWGTKWDAYDVETTCDDEHLLAYTFTTAWAPPSVVICAASTLFEHLDFHLFFDEPGAGGGGVEMWRTGALRAARYAPSLMGQHWQRDQTGDLREHARLSAQIAQTEHTLLTWARQN